MLTHPSTVTIKYLRGDVELAWDARDKLIRRLRHLDAAKPIIAKLAAAKPSQPVELTPDEKGFLVVAVKAWMQDVGRDRVPNTVLRLRETLMGDVYYPEAGPEPEEVPATAEAVETLEPEAVVQTVDETARARHLAAALTAIEEARAELAAAFASVTTG